MKKQNYKVTYESEKDILSIWLSNEESDSVKQTGDVRAHLANDGKLVCIEFLHAVEFLKAQSKALPKDVKQSVFA